ncbi:hypothetical protein MKW94_005303, partial [Papaver nudicaule]|nr:hypothetical protein [Papaver nudicaule]
STFLVCGGRVKKKFGCFHLTVTYNFYKTICDDYGVCMGKFYCEVCKLLNED